MAMEFLPQPKRAEARSGVWTLTPHTRIVLRPGTAPEALLYAEMLRDAVRDQAGFCPALGRGEAAGGDIALGIDPALPAVRYTLTVSPEGAVIAAGDDEALCNLSLIHI